MGNTKRSNGANRASNANNKRKQACNDNNSARLNRNESTLVLWPIIFTIYICYTSYRPRQNGPEREGCIKEHER